MKYCEAGCTWNGCQQPHTEGVSAPCGTMLLLIA